MIPRMIAEVVAELYLFREKKKWIFPFSLEPGRPLALPNLAEPDLLVFHCRTIGQLPTRTHASFTPYFTHIFFNMSFETMTMTQNSYKFSSGIFPWTTIWKKNPNRACFNWFSWHFALKILRLGTSNLCQNLSELPIVRTVWVGSAEPTRRPCSI